MSALRFCAIVAALMSMAETAAATTLICDRYTRSDQVEDTSTSFDVDEANSTVTVHSGAFHCVGGATCNAPERVRGPFQATFGESEIRFNLTDSPGLTGVINRYGGDVRFMIDGTPTTSRWTCHPASKQF
jgi:hypothetical protein